MLTLLLILKLSVTPELLCGPKPLSLPGCDGEPVCFCDEMYNCHWEFRC